MFRCTQHTRSYSLILSPFVSNEIDRDTMQITGVTIRKRIYLAHSQAILTDVALMLSHPFRIDVFAVSPIWILNLAPEL